MKPTIRVSGHYGISGHQIPTHPGLPARGGALTEKRFLSSQYCHILILIGREVRVVTAAGRALGA